MPGLRLQGADGTRIEYSARVFPFLTHEQSRPRYADQAEFAITEIHFRTSIGTVLDAPYHRYPAGRDISELRLEEVILPGVALDLRGRRPHEAVGPAALPPDLDLTGKAVLLNFGWDVHWGENAYHAFPFLAADAIDALIDRGVALVGVDTPNVDDTRDPRRPAHTRLLRQEIPIVENLTHLDALLGRHFRFFAVPWRAKGVAALPVRAFAELDGWL
ncbi:MAG: cyclase family protein [Deltaproteobacteria bacterium]|nr:MAG: cyclase family protein [Deltaproteobacteria bacterium]